MNLADILSQEAVLPNMEAQDRKEALEELIRPLLALHPEIAGFDIVHALCEREHMGSTAVGEGVAIPHGKVPGLRRLALAVGRSLAGIDFNAPDKKTCHLFFLILTPEAGAGQHLKLLAQIARRARDQAFRSEALLAKNRAQLWRTLTAP